MASRLTVIFYIVLCLEAGFVLTLVPWLHPFGMGDWANNYFLVLAAEKTGFVGLQQAVASGWVRGAVTGLGLLNLAMAFWEIAHFKQTVRRLQGADAKAEAPAALPVSNLPVSKATQETSLPPPAAAPDASPSHDSDHLSHHAGHDR